jgi:hypothetical protein
VVGFIPLVPFFAPTEHSPCVFLQAEGLTVFSGTFPSLRGTPE